MSTAEQSASPRQHKVRLSLVVVGCGALILVSFLVPYFSVPFGGEWYIQILSGVTFLLGVASLRRKERGTAAAAAAVVTVAAGGIFLFWMVFPYFYDLASRILMPN